MELIKVNENNFEEIIKLKTKAEKLGYVDSVLYSLAECFADKDHMEAFGIYNDEVIIGFVSIYFEGNFGQIINFFIKDEYQNQSYGTRTIGLLLDLFKNLYKVETVSVGVYKDNKKAFDFWDKLGFINTGNIEGDYEFFRNPLNKIGISNELYLTKYFSANNLSIKWYQDVETVKMVDNAKAPYDLNQLKTMYNYLNNNGDLFYIVYENKLIGDCAIFDDNMVAIVISKEYRGRKIGSKVLDLLINFAKEKKLAYLKAEIYDFNQASKILFKSKGFEKVGKEMYKLDLIK